MMNPVASLFQCTCSRNGQPDASRKNESQWILDPGESEGSPSSQDVGEV